MITDEYRCPNCGLIILKRHIQDTSQKACPTCGSGVAKVWNFAYTKLAWHAPDRSRTGSDRMVIRSARQGKPAGPLSDGSDTLQTNLGLTR
jgi:DNA-directed RNA polymerase subunit RPC12/RpoP